ncbi:hypothetical protein Agabi119p4_8889 [Agaricus bisporus var. burnettii]|uniref:Uncharacterized protein n=1 Tax=Agaricus bisporus var. burnettii TaxID=192524 RepID=A0A8H7EXM6_AGABI|nr:hypothetical protein Agabi119p4_8889 [Agaricus bisporus var. burnettii]
MVATFKPRADELGDLIGAFDVFIAVWLPPALKDTLLKPLFRSLAVPPHLILSELVLNYPFFTRAQAELLHLLSPFLSPCHQIGDTIRCFGGSAKHPFLPGTNWTSWFTFLVAGVMQATLLVMCIAWKFRQRRLGIDDFGNPVVPPTTAEPADSGGIVVEVTIVFIPLVRICKPRILGPSGDIALLVIIETIPLSSMAGSTRYVAYDAEHITSPKINCFPRWLTGLSSGLRHNAAGGEK